MARRFSSPAALFDAAAHPEREDELFAEGLEVVARPGMAAPADLDGDVFVVRRALGEGRLAVVSAVEGVVASRGPLQAEGVLCEGWGEGVFVEVRGGRRGRRAALRIADAEGWMREDTVVLRPLRDTTAFVPAPPPPATEDDATARALPEDDVRDRLEAAAAPLPSPAPNPNVPMSTAAPPETEGADDPVNPLRPALVIRGTVGRGGRNQAADVQAVQDRLLELRALDATDAATERPAAAGVVAEPALPRTIEAVERFQGWQGLPATGLVELRGPIRTDLDRALPQPTAAELAAVQRERATIAEVVSRGLTLRGAVGDTATGNAPDDVRAVQRRLVELNRLEASHRESPAAGATAPVPASALRATIAALRAFQDRDVRFWRAKGVAAGAVTRDAVAPGDATEGLLNRIAAYTETLGSATVSLRDHVVSGATHSAAGVAFAGIAAPSALPVADYVGQGLTREQAASLKFVSTHEGNFDAINTYDRALVSAGFIQFAGGRGLPPYLGLLKIRQPAKFGALLQRFGVDVEFTVARGAVASARVAVLDPAGSRVLRGTAAETAIRDDKKLTALLVFSGRDRDVQLAQIEAAIRGYVRPILGASVSWAPGRAATLGLLLRSKKGMAAAFDRAIQEGVDTARRRFERLLQRLARPAAPPAPGTPAPTVTDMQAREGDLLAEVERDLQAAADVGARMGRARSGLAALLGAASAAGATPASVLGRPELADVRRVVAEARAGMAGVVNVAPAARTTVDATLSAMTATLTGEETRLLFTPAPTALADLVEALRRSDERLASVAAPVVAAPMFLARIQRIRRSTLDAALGEEA